MSEISIIVPIYKVEPYIRRCIDSIISQTFTDFELILVDDGSPDNCPAICDEYANKDSRIVVIHKKNGGLSDARNAGIEAAVGDWIMFVDSDDYISENMAELLYNAVTEQHADIAMCGIGLFENDSDVTLIDCWNMESGVYSGAEIISRKLEVQYVVACNKIYARHIWQSIRYPIGCIHEDEFVAHRIYGICDKVVCIEDVLYYYRQRQDSIMHFSYSISRLDYFDAMIDRILYYFEINNVEFIDDLLYQFYDELRGKYFRIEDNKQNHFRLKKCRRDAQKVLHYFLKCKNVSMTIKIATLIFIYCPTIYKIIWCKKTKI